MESVSVVVVGIEVVVMAKQSEHRASLSRSSHIIFIGSQVFTIFRYNPIFLFSLC